MEVVERSGRPREVLSADLQEKIASISEQPAAHRIKELFELSKYKHDFDTHGNIVISNETLGVYTIEKIENPEDPAVQQIFDLQIETFGEDETDPINILKESIQGPESRNYHPSEEKQHVFVIKDNQGKVVNVMMGGLLKTEGKSFDHNQRTFMITYAITSPDYRRRGLGKEIYAATLLQMAQEAQAKNFEITYAFGETESDSEAFWNSVGLRRVYVQKGNTVLDESKYYQPPIDFDSATGRAIGDRAPLHLMIDTFAPHNKNPEVNKPIEWRNDCVGMVAAANEWSSEWAIDAFNQNQNRPFNNRRQAISPYERHLQYSRRELKAFARDIKSGTRVLLLTAKTRSFFREHGWTILEHTAADTESDSQEE